MVSLNMPKKIQLLIHSIGLSSIGSAIFLQSTVFSSILKNGYFVGMEHNQAILHLEITLTGVAATYFIYILIKFVITRL